MIWGTMIRVILNYVSLTQFSQVRQDNANAHSRLRPLDGVWKESGANTVRLVSPGIFILNIRPSVIVPLAVITTWDREIQRLIRGNPKFKDFKVYIYHGPKRKKGLSNWRPLKTD